MKMPHELPFAFMDVKGLRIPRRGKRHAAGFGGRYFPGMLHDCRAMSEWAMLCGFSAVAACWWRDEYIHGLKMGEGQKDKWFRVFQKCSRALEAQSK